MIEHYIAWLLDAVVALLGAVNLLILWGALRLRRDMLAATEHLNRTRAEYENRMAVLAPILSQIPPGATIISATVGDIEHQTRH